MNRRLFLRLLGLGAAGAVVDPDALLWTPGKKTIFLPAERPMRIPGVTPPDGWLAAANSLRTGDIITIEGVYAINPPFSGLQKYIVGERTATEIVLTQQIDPAILDWH